MDAKIFEETFKDPSTKKTKELGSGEVYGVPIPYIFKDRLLMDKGVWNKYFYSEEEILKAFKNTDWSNRLVTSLFFDHEDEKAREWIGEVKNVRLENNITLGDLYIYDLNTAVKLAKGKPKFGISPKVVGEIADQRMTNFVFDNFSLVMNPAIKTARFSKQKEESDMTETKNEKVESTDKPLTLSEDSLNEIVTRVLKALEAKKLEEEKPAEETSEKEIVAEEKPKETKEETEEETTEDTKTDDTMTEVNDLKKVIETMSTKIDTLQKENETPKRFSTTAVNLAQDSTESARDQADTEMLKLLKSGGGC